MEPELATTGKLFLVPTPIGNLDDITLRALQVLRSVDIIACEEPNHSRKFLQHYGIQSRIFHYHEQGNYTRKLEELVKHLQTGSQVAYISSAGTPGISDPSFALVRECIELSIHIDCLAGPTALIPALVVSGLPSYQFVFRGFLPFKGRKQQLLEIANDTRTTILYESPLKIQKLVDELCTLCSNDRKVCLVRELSKLFEEVIRTTLGELQHQLHPRRLKGEITFLIEGKQK